MDPNREFRIKKRSGRTKKKYSGEPYGSPRPDTTVLMIRCDATNCGHKTLISRNDWLGKEEIVCSNCGETNLWGTL